MMLLVSGTTATLRRLAPISGGRLGALLTPDSGNSVRSVGKLPWACDNAAFTGFKPDRFLRMLGRVVAAKRRPLWVSCPDVVADADATLDRFAVWQPVLAAVGLPVALVAQDGLTGDIVTWGRIDCLFIGGSTKWKLGAVADELCREAKRRGKLVHVGRVNSLRRLELAYRMGADSVDGGSMSRFGDTHIPRFLRCMKRLEQHPALW